MKLLIIFIFVNLTLFIEFISAAVVLDTTYAANGNSFAAHQNLANQNQFSGVGYLHNTKLNQNIGTATWIGGKYVLTAAHCLVAPQSVVPASNYQFVVQSGGKDTFYDAAVLHIPNAWFISEGYNYETDVALIELKQAVNVVGVTPATIADNFVNNGFNELGVTFTAMGYGARALGSTGEDGSNYGTGLYDNPPTKMAFTNTVDEITDFKNLVADFDDGTVAKSTRGSEQLSSEFEGILAGGDSGGSAWVKLHNGQWVVIGVNSWGSARSGDEIEPAYGYISGFVRVMDHFDWIKNIYSGVNSIPEPNSSLLILFSIILLILKRKRAKIAKL